MDWPTTNKRPTTDRPTYRRGIKYSRNRAWRPWCPTNNLLKVWQNSAPFGGWPISGTVVALLTKILNRRLSVLPILVFLLPPPRHCCWHVTNIAYIVTLSSGAESIILSEGCAETIMLSTHTESIILSAPPAESIIFSAPLAESMLLSARRWHNPQTPHSGTVHQQCSVL